MNNKRPGNVSTAIKIVYFAVVLGLLNSIFFFDQIIKYTNENSGGAEVSEPYVILIFAMSLAFTLFLTWSAGSGKNWARITFLISAILGSYSVIYNLNNIQPFTIVGNLIAVANYYAIYLLFTGESNRWFKSIKNKNATFNIQVTPNQDEIKNILNLTSKPIDVDQLEKLHALLKLGAITQEEFDNQKKIIFSRAA